MNSLETADRAAPAPPQPASAKDAPAPLGRVLVAFLACTWLTVLINVGRLVWPGAGAGVGAGLFSGAVLVSYAAIYLLPAALAAGLGAWALGPARRERALWRGLLLGLVTALAAAAQVLLVVDVAVFRILGFHLNGFVWNVLLTPGGVESMGGDAQTKLHVATTLGAVVLAQVGLAVAAARLAGTRFVSTLADRLSRRRGLALALAVIACGAGERVAYGVTALDGQGPLQEIAGTVPLYLPCTFGHFARRYGLTGDDDDGAPRLREVRAIQYPLHPLQLAAERPRWNVVWLVAESLRADMVDPRVMPSTHAFAQQAQWFQNHLSAGNGTRMGMFGMFYGLYGSYWFPFLGARRGPVLIDQLRADDYRFSVHTSARFSYPEFDQTLWAALPRQELCENEVPEAWDRDRSHVDEILSCIDQDDPRPFFAFMFFEGTHARYHFPAAGALEPDYLDQFDYSVYDDPTRLRQEIGRIKNRYVNACHQLDTQIGRVVERLRARGLLERTIVVVTGDHGEEFLEHGRWGHNSAFTREQIRPPLLLHVPGRAPAVHRELTSHMDLPVTVLRALGVTSPAEHFAQGQDLFQPRRRDYVILADWNSLVVSTADERVVFPLGAIGVHHKALIKDDGSPGDPADFHAAHRQALLDVAAGLRAFAAR